jgi:hypothetical protein
MKKRVRLKKRSKFQYRPNPRAVWRRAGLTPPKAEPHLKRQVSEPPPVPPFWWAEQCSETMH